MREHTTYIDLTIGPYRVALRTDCVTAVVQDLVPSPIDAGTGSAETAQLKGRELPLIDLRDSRDELGRASTPRSGTIPFVVGVETATGGCAVAADRIDYVGAGELRSLRIPRFGLQRPDLFREAVHDGKRLLLVLDAAALERLATA